VFIKKTHMYEWPVRVDWQSPDRESQILMVLSSLALAICFPSGLHATDLTLQSRAVSTRINRNREGKTREKTIYQSVCPVKIMEKNLQVRVPGQRRLAFSRLRVPNLDGSVITAAGNYLSIGAPRHREDPEITRSHHTNQQKQKGKNFEKKFTNSSARSASTGILQIASPKS